MKLKEKIAVIVCVFAAFCFLLYLVKSALTPFICSIVIAYFLNPLVERFHRKYHINRLRATSLILGLFFATLISTGLLIFPVMYSQTVDFIDAVPGYMKIFTVDFYPKISVFLNKFGFSLDKNFADLAQKEELASKVLNFSKEMLDNAISSSSAIIDILSLVFIMPILLFYFLKDWDVMVRKIDEYLPKNGGQQIRKVITDIDKTMSGYIRGQFNVCLMLGIFYAALLSCTGLNFGFLIGFMTGMLVFIPYVGMLIGVTTAIIVALFQWGFDFGNIGLVSLVFLIGQVVESNFLTPKLVGSRIGLHPLWLIFGLFFFGVLFGFTGVLFAVPLTAISGVVVKHVATEYKKRFV
jgi:predicted PurR-regulated permease PerM